MRLHVVALAAVVLMAAGPAGSDSAPGGYAVRLQVVPAPGGGVQRLDLPAAAIAALRNPDATDIRVFDARGRLVPIARVAPAAPQRRDRLSAAPILGRRDMPVGARVSVRLDERGRARVAEVDSGAASGGDVIELGALLDTRVVVGLAERVDLDVDIPAGQPVRLMVEASRDLDSWRPLGERVLYRAPGTAAADARIALGSAVLYRDYLRIIWHATPPLIAPVRVRGAVLVSRAEQGLVLIAARAPALVDDHSVEFLAPPAALAALRVVPAGGDGPMLIQILGRDEAEQPWTVLGSGIAAADRPAVELRAGAPRILRVEADRRGAGFSAPPGLELGFAPRAVAFLAAGTGPFTLAAGRAGAEDVFTDANILGGASDIATARVQADGITIPPVLIAPNGVEPARRRLVLWGVLSGAVALLGGLAWMAWRRRPTLA